MLSAPAKSARRISSLFNVRSSRDSGTLSASSSGSPNLHPDQQHMGSRQSRPRSSSRPAVRHASSPQPNSTESHLSTSHGPVEPLDLDHSTGPLQPPPSLLAVNNELHDDSSSRGRHGRTGSRSSSVPRPLSSAGLAASIRGVSSRRTSPDSQNRLSLMIGKPEDGSMGSPLAHGYDAWVAGLDQKIPYDLEPLAQGETVRSNVFTGDFLMHG
jgi:hypothetical protein